MLVLAALALVTPAAGSLLLTALALTRRLHRLVVPVALGVGLVELIAVVALAAQIGPRPLVWQVVWFGPPTIGFGLFVDDLAILFALAIAVVNLLSLIYSVRYLPYEIAHAGIERSEAAYYAGMLLFSGAMIGLVLAVDLIQLYVFWELTAIASFLLIGYDWRRADARSGAVWSAVVTVGAGMVMLIGFLLLGLGAGTFDLSALLADTRLLQESPLVSAIVLAVLVGTAAKSAQVPFHIWLPRAMVAPTPVSAFLHSAALVAAGIYLLARLWPLLAPHPFWQAGLLAIGVASGAVGAVVALKQTDLKAILAYSTIAQYGAMVTLLGLGHASAVAAALFLFLTHAILKAGLFFCAGIVGFATGERDLRRLGGLAQRLPATFAVTAILALSLGGLPPLNGFWAKEELLAELSATGNPLALGAFAMSGALTITYLLRFLTGIFFGPTAADKQPAVPPLSMLAVPATLALLALAFSLLPGLPVDLLVDRAAAAATGRPVAVRLAIHLDSALVLSSSGLIAGTLAFIFRALWLERLERLLPETLALSRGYLAIAAGLTQIAGRVLALQNGDLRRYMAVTLAGLVALLALFWRLSPTALLASTAAPIVPLAWATWGAIVLLALVAIATILTFVLAQHFHAIIALATVGYLLAGVFALLLAPDVGLVQVHVETLTAVIFAAVLFLTPARVRQPFVRPVRTRLTPANVALALLVGGAATLLSLQAFAQQPEQTVATWFIEHGPALADATDVVASILVQFRALDTLGEIIVFAVAAAGVYALVDLMRSGRP